MADFREYSLEGVRELFRNASEHASVELVACAVGGGVGMGVAAVGLGAMQAAVMAHDLALSVPILIESAMLLGPARELEREQQREWDAMISRQENERRELNEWHMVEKEQAVAGNASTEKLQQLDATHNLELASLRNEQESEARTRQETNMQSMEKLLQPVQERLEQAQQQALVLGQM